MRTQVEAAFALACRVSGRLVTALVLGKVSRRLLIDAAFDLEKAAGHLRRALTEMG